VHKGDNWGFAAPRAPPTPVDALTASTTRGLPHAYHPKNPVTLVSPRFLAAFGSGAAPLVAVSAWIGARARVRARCVALRRGRSRAAPCANCPPPPSTLPHSPQTPAARRRRPSAPAAARAPPRRRR